MELLDVVVLTKNLPSENLSKGALGTIVELLDEDTFLVEFSDRRGVTYAMTELAVNQLMKVYEEPMSLAA